MLVVSAVVLLSVAGFLGSVGATIGVRMVPVFVQFQRFEVIVIVWLACAACADIIITTVLVLHLVSAVFDLLLLCDKTYDFYRGIKRVDFLPQTMSSIVSLHVSHLACG